jgi:hypothetical protein
MATSAGNNRFDVAFIRCRPARRAVRKQSACRIAPDPSSYQFRRDKSDESGAKVVGSDRKMPLALINGHNR